MDTVRLEIVSPSTQTSEQKGATTCGELIAFEFYHKINELLNN